MTKIAAFAAALIPAFAIAIIIGCQSGQKAPVCGTVLSFFGTSTVFENGKELPAAVGQAIHNGDVVRVGSGSRFVASFGGSRTIVAGAATVFVVDSMEGAEPFRIPLVHCLDGELYCKTICQVECGETDSSPARILTSIEGTQFHVRFSKSDTAAIITCLSGMVTVRSLYGRETEVPSCYKLLMRSGQPQNGLAPTTSADYARVAKCEGLPPDSAGRISLCAQLESELVPAVANKPPAWTTAPKTECRAFSFFADTLAARDPEGGAVVYNLVSGPNGMKLGSRTGIITFKAKKPATYDIIVSAADSEGAATATSYKLVVTKKQVVASRPAAVPQKPVAPAPDTTAQIQKKPAQALGRA